MTLTVREKEHWKERITRKIDQAIETVCAAEDPNFLERIRRRANEQALESLGIAQIKREVGSIDEQKEKLDAKRRVLQRKQLAVIRGVEVDSVTDAGYHDHYEVTAAIRRREELLEKELLDEDELGQRILKLRHEKEELLDTVWLATSSKHIKQLWSTVADILRQEPTALQREALMLDPVENGEVKS